MSQLFQAHKISNQDLITCIWRIMSSITVYMHYSYFDMSDLSYEKTLAVVYGVLYYWILFNFLT